MRLLFLCLLATLSTQSYGQMYQALTWEDLKPKKIIFDDPFDKLSPVQLKSLSIVARVQTLEKHKPETVSRAMKQEKDSLVIVLTRQHINIDSLLAIRFKIAEQRKLATESVVKSLNGKAVSISGYILPLDYANSVSTEFLLVPWIGACIHIPPPPKNQIIYIKHNQGYEAASQFEAVIIEGLVTTNGKSAELYLVDGSDNINAGYSMDADAIKPFKE